MTVVAIDGPGGSGKSTVARELARRLGVERLDTGAMYRAVALRALRTGTPVGDEKALTGVAREMVLELGDPVLLDGEDVSDAIRGDDVEAVVSTVAAHPAVREVLVSRQRDWIAAHGSCVVEGRDIGTVVAPGADLKVYLTADPSERARRRAEDERAVASRGRGGERGDPAVVRRSIGRRDALDRGRAASPLAVAPGAVVVDSTGRSVEEVVEELWGLL
ncbi:MAG: (d)CMP kinase [Actinomycetota bacterium]|nr:(d)CMP kinase [Actinomycetota bacterium]